MLTKETLADIQNAINARGIWCVLPSAVSKSFAERKQQEFVELARIGWPLLILMIGLIITVLWVQFRNILVGHNAVVWWWLIGLTITIVTAAIIAVQFPAVQRRYVPVLTCVGMVAAATMLTGGMLFQDAMLAQEVYYVSTMAVIIIMLPLKLPLAASTLSCLGGLIIGVMVALLLGVTPAWTLILTYYLGSIIIVFFIGLLMQRQERINFLQGLLLEHESAERMRLNAMLEKLALEDQLTGLANRRCFDDVLGQEWERCQRAQQPLALLFIDIDYFKRYNDSYGHAAGDLCLTRIGQTLKNSLLRPADLAARYGGEEFVILLPETSMAGALGVAQRVLADIDTLAMPHQESDVAAYVTASIGVVSQIPDYRYSSSALLMEHADRALYQAKQAGRHQVMVSVE
jgi:diguanylate cyclase (GGDEF)-like protein